MRRLPLPAVEERLYSAHPAKNAGVNPRKFSGTCAMTLIGLLRSAQDVDQDEAAFIQDENLR